MNSKNSYRDQFPYLQSGKKYFNHAAISPLPICVKDKIDNYLIIRSETEIEPYFETLAQADGAKEKLANLLSVDSNLLAWSSNVSNSLNILAQGIKWNHGDEIILNDIEFPSNVYPFINLRSQGVNIIFAKSENGCVDIPQIENLISRRTRLISISMVQFLTGYRTDLKSIGELCRKRDIMFCVDGIQGVGTVQINLEECNIDFFAGGTHKWLMSLQGLGYFYISKRLMEVIDQKYVGWTSVKNPWELLEYDLKFTEGAKRFENGTLPRIAIIAFNSSLELIEQIGLRKMEDKIIQNSIYLRNSLTEIGIKTYLDNKAKNQMAGIISFGHKHSRGIVEKLENQNIICSEREGIVRISPHFYNDVEELDHLIFALRAKI